jgi:hypothetical protein
MAWDLQGGDDAREEDGDSGGYWREDDNVGGRRGEWGTTARMMWRT